MNREVTIDWPSVRAMKPITAKRRMVWPGPEMNILTIPDHPLGHSRGRALRWIEKRTSGQFYLGGNKVAFMDEQDEILFKLGFK